LRNPEKWLREGGNLDVISPAIEVKKSLKQLATVSDLEITDPLMNKEMGVEEQLDLTEIMSRTPDHTFCILFEW